MKKIFTFILICISALPSFSQILIEEHFDTYMNTPPTPPTVPAGWFISWNNADTAVAALSYYYSTSPTYQFCGMSCPTYKFGIDSAYAITPMFTGADSVRFYMKGNGTQKPNHFQIYGGPDTSTWNLIRSFDTIATTASVVTLPVPLGSHFLKFIYLKDSSGYNVGFDDVYIFTGPFPAGIADVSKTQLSLFPNPSRGLVTFDFNGTHPKNATLTFNNVLGTQVRKISLQGSETKYQVDLSEFQDGVYFVKIKTDLGESTQRIVLKK